jgi:hypothetical protein
MPVRNVILKNIRLGGNKGIEIRDAKDIKLENLTISNEEGSAADISFAENIQIDDIKIVDTDEDEVPFVITDVKNSSLAKVQSKTEGDIAHISGESDNVKIDNSVPEKRIKKD